MKSASICVICGHSDRSVFSRYGYNVCHEIPVGQPRRVLHGRRRNHHTGSRGAAIRPAAPGWQAIVDTALLDRDAATRRQIGDLPRCHPNGAGGLRYGRAFDRLNADRRAAVLQVVPGLPDLAAPQRFLGSESAGFHGLLRPGGELGRDRLRSRIRRSGGGATCVSLTTMS